MIQEHKYDKRFIEYIIHFNDLRDYYACHDFLEDLWLETKREYDVLRYLIQLAVMQYKKVKQVPLGFLKLYSNSVNFFDSVKNDLEILGIDANQLYQDLQKLKLTEDLVEFDLKLTDQELINLVKMNSNI